MLGTELPLEPKVTLAYSRGEGEAHKIGAISVFVYSDGWRYHVVNPQDGSKIGRIVPGCSWAGSLWSRGDCIAEYEARGKKWLITPVEKGFKLFPKRTLEHPLKYLVRCSRS